ncbi:MAG: hypothetical protein V1646_01135 [bacterium]
MKFSKKLMLSVMSLFIGAASASIKSPTQVIREELKVSAADFKKARSAFQEGIKQQLHSVKPGDDLRYVLVTRVASIVLIPGMNGAAGVIAAITALDEDIKPWIKTYFKDKKSDENRVIVIEAIERIGNRAEYVNLENQELRADVRAWVKYSTQDINHFFNPAKFEAAPAIQGTIWNPLNWFKTAPKAEAKAKSEAKPAPVEVAEPTVVLDTAWFDSAKALVTGTAVEETRKKELDKNLLVALNAWIANPANVASKMAELNAVAVKTSPAVVDYFKSLEILIKSPVVDGINTLDAYKAYARAQWEAGNKMPALVLITKIELGAAEAAK